MARLTLLTAHLVVALVALVAIGGATRVMEAGLACPDWPLCYGSLFPGSRLSLQVFLEWFHRLDAFLVGVALLVLFGFSLWRRRELPAALPWGAGLALALVAFQGAGRPHGAPVVARRDRHRPPRHCPGAGGPGERPASDP
ncbi:COX15/CtaA family protein [Cyanobium sp. ATX-6F1]|uniref:COX15/CtaA family protein n=1 Tax=Cyanobium sp. ATX-6F1 TaxID=3137388 RepID=UPI0039BDD147